MLCRDADKEANQAQLQLLLAELKRIEGQQQQLKTAAAENKVLIVHPVKGFDLDEEDEYAEEEEVKPNPDRFIPSGQPKRLFIRIKPNAAMDSCESFAGITMVQLHILLACSPHLLFGLYGRWVDRF